MSLADAERDEALHRRRLNRRNIQECAELPGNVNYRFSYVGDAVRLLEEQNYARGRIIRRLRAENARLRARLAALNTGLEGH